MLAILYRLYCMTGLTAGLGVGDALEEGRYNVPRRCAMSSSTLRYNGLSVFVHRFSPLTVYNYWRD